VVLPDATSLIHEASHASPVDALAQYRLIVPPVERRHPRFRIATYT
jgi:hypothetical protein